MLVQLKENVIFGGAFYPFDTVIEEEKLPEMFRDPHYIKPPGPPRESDWEEFPVDDMEPRDEDEEPEEEPPKPPPKRR